MHKHSLTRLGALAILLGSIVMSMPAVMARPSPAIVQLTLRSTVFHNTRRLHVLLPPGYADQENRSRRYPVFYFLDGRAAFDAWGVPKVAADLSRRHQIPPTIFVGVDNGGSTLETRHPVSDRASEYLPYPDPSWTTPDAPAPRGEHLPSFLFDEVMPLVNRRFRTRNDSAGTALAGDSFAGAAVLYVAMHHPARLGAILIESPSLHIGNGRLLADARTARAWPPAIYLGVGTSEGDALATQREMVDNVCALNRVLREAHPEVRTHVEITRGGTHGYDAWRGRLPGALRWLLNSPLEAGGSACP